MLKHNQNGGMALIVSLILSIVLFIAAAAFGAWAYSGRQDYKNNVDAKISTAVQDATAVESKTKDAQFAEAEKSPVRTYHGPEAYGSLSVSYPKTWSAYVDDSGNGNALVDGYFYPGTVPSISNQHSVFALRVQVLSQTYTQTLQNYTNAQQSTGSGQTPLTITPYALPKVPKVVGVKASGTLPNTQQVVGTAVVLPLRSQTLIIWTMGTQFLNDYNTYILPNFSFSP